MGDDSSSHNERVRSAHRGRGRTEVWGGDPAGLLAASRHGAKSATITADRRTSTMNRRKFVGGTLAGVAALSSAGGAKAKSGDVPRRAFGKTGEKVSVIGQAGGRFPLCSYDEAKAVTLRAYELGLKLLRQRSRLLGRALGGSLRRSPRAVPQGAVPDVTKSVGRTRKEAEADLHASLEALKTDYVDLWQIHAVGEMEDVDRIFAQGGAIEAFEAAKKAGKTRFIGFTGHHDPDVHLEMLRRYEDYDTILMPLNPADPGYLSFEKKVLPMAVERGMGIQAIKSLANAKLLQSFSVKQCLEYVLSLPIHCAAVGCTTIGQIEDDVRVASALSALSETQREEVRARAERLAGPHLENWKRNVETAAVYEPVEYHGA